MTTTHAPRRVLDLDHYKLRSEIRLAAPGEMDPVWEISAALTTEDRVYADGIDGTEMLRHLDRLLDDPEITAVFLTLWVQA